jgi:hypothetical protein
MGIIMSAAGKTEQAQMPLDRSELQMRCQAVELFKRNG